MQTTHNGQGGGKPTIIGQRGLKQLSNKSKIDNVTANHSQWPRWRQAYHDWPKRVGKQKWIYFYCVATLPCLVDKWGMLSPISRDN